MLNVHGKGCVALCIERVEIGAGYNRSHAIERDSSTGDYWERLPELTYYEERIQKALLNSPTHVPMPIDLTRCGND